MAKEVTDAQFEELVLHSDLPVLVDFWASWCGPCRGMSPIIEELAKDYEGKVNVFKMSVEENQVTPTKYNIRAIPTFILFKNGEVIARPDPGSVPKKALADLLDKAL